MEEDPKKLQVVGIWALSKSYPDLKLTMKQQVVKDTHYTFQTVETTFKRMIMHDIQKKEGWIIH